MASTAATPAKISAQLLQDYLEAQRQRKEIERQAKPFADKERELGKQILTALLDSGLKTKKAGPYRVNLIEKPGTVGWKEVLVSRLSTAELQEIEQQYAANVRQSIEVVEA